MKNINILCIVLILTVYSAVVNAQKLELSNFLSDVGLSHYLIGSSINNLKEKPELDKIENGLNFYSCNEQIPDEIFGFGMASRLHLIVINDTIKKVGFSIIMDPDTYKVFSDTLITMYGKPTTLKKIYPEISKWEKGYLELSLIYYPGSVTFDVQFGKKVVPIIPPKEWIYSERKGKGTSKLGLNLKYFETLANLNLTSSQFEELMPIWFTNGLENHLVQSYNQVTKNHDIPEYIIAYQVTNNSNKYFATINTKDTIKKYISDYRFSGIKNQTIISTLKVDLQNFGYKIDTQGMAVEKAITGINSNEKDYINKSKKILISIGKAEAGYYIYLSKL